MELVLFSTAIILNGCNNPVSSNLKKGTLDEDKGKKELEAIFKCGTECEKNIKGLCKEIGCTDNMQYPDPNCNAMNKDILKESGVASTCNESLSFFKMKNKYKEPCSVCGDPEFNNCNTNISDFQDNFNLEVTCGEINDST